MKNIYMKLFVLILVCFISLTGCTSIPNEDIGKLQQDYNALSQENSNLKTEIETKDAEIEELTKDKEEYEQLKTKYEGLSESEVLAQTEANKLKADQDRIAQEQIAEEKAKTEQEETAKKAAEEEEANEGYETGITYDQLATTPDEFEGKKVKFTGWVIQVVEDTDKTVLRIAVEDNFDTVILAYYDPSIVDTMILDGEQITIYGVSKGLQSYDSTLAGTITIPMVEVEKIDK